MWWWVLAVVLALWANVWGFHGIEWYSLGLGFFTGGMLICWAVEMTGNKVPDSWRKGAGSGSGSAAEK
jgi:hypothetical protein